MCALPESSARAGMEVADGALQILQLSLVRRVLLEEV